MGHSRAPCACRDSKGEEEEELTPWKEQENWEAHQVAKASMAAGARDRKQAAQEYDFVLPDAVEFITAQALAGNLVGCSLQLAMGSPWAMTPMLCWCSRLHAHALFALSAPAFAQKPSCCAGLLCTRACSQARSAHGV